MNLIKQFKTSTQRIFGLAFMTPLARAILNLTSYINNGLNFGDSCFILMGIILFIGGGIMVFEADKYEKGDEND